MHPGVGHPERHGVVAKVDRQFRAGAVQRSHPNDRSRKAWFTTVVSIDEGDSRIERQAKRPVLQSGYVAEHPHMSVTNEQVLSDRTGTEDPACNPGSIPPRVEARFEEMRPPDE
jgi:hypothetical protein